MSGSISSSASVVQQNANALANIACEPLLVTVGVVLYEWNDAVRQRVQRLGAQLGQSGIKIQLLTHSDLVRHDEKVKHLRGVIYQLPPDADTPIAKRFEMIFRHSLQHIITSGTVAAALSIPDDSGRANVEQAIMVSLGCHAAHCQWLGMVDESASGTGFQQWCEGIANSVRQFECEHSTLAT